MTNLTQTNSLYIPKELDTNFVDNQLNDQFDPYKFSVYTNRTQTQIQ